MVTPNSGDPTRYEGVQDQEPTSYDAHYWHPEDTRPFGDFSKQFHGFPAYPGLLAGVIQGFPATGLRMPWYTVYGNHDGLMQGNAPVNPVLNAIAVGSVKIVNLPAGMSPGDFQTGLSTQNPAVLAALATAPARTVTPDATRAIVSPQQWVDAHLQSGNGHGLTDANKQTVTLYYTFKIATGVLGISLDTVNRGGYADGSLGTTQFNWLKDQLDRNKDQLVVLFSHHNLLTLGNPVPDPAGAPGSDPQRVLGAAIENLLHQYPSVVAWVNGHSHVNRITPHPDPSGTTGGFWEISTAAHIDYPQHARLIELVDNRDGTISIFATLIDHAAPTQPSTLSRVLDLAALSRELAANDFQFDGAAAVGLPTDRNVELVLKAPPASILAADQATFGPMDGFVGGTGPASGGLPATGWRATPALALGGAALAAAIALRNRATAAADDESARADG
jgi:metallophosphoesterase (TIGR03767 family)